MRTGQVRLGIPFAVRREDTEYIRMLLAKLRICRLFPVKGRSAKDLLAAFLG